jgi:glutamate/tyrosine decarboxylase-like PLP-dependent enzyme
VDDDSWFDPDLSPEEFRRLGYRVVDMIADYYEGIRETPVFPVRTPADVMPAFEEPVPVEGQDPDAILDAWSRDILPNSTHMGSPRFFGYVMGSGTMIGTLAEALAASVNTNAGGWKPAPAATEIERRTLAWVSEIIGYAPGAGGILLSGGTMANVAALTTALRNTAPWDTTATGLQDPRREGRFRVYMADHETHVSLYRATDMMNLGRDAVRTVPSADDFRMDVAGLRRALDEDRARGDVPFCVVGHVGSINVGAIDPLDEIADVCQEQGLWFHADGACGAVGAMLPELRARYRGMERADSVSLDPHKWLYVPYECGLLLVREAEKLHRAFSMSASYLKGTLPTEYTGHDFFEYGPQMSRGFRALKLWMTLKHYGVEGYRKLLGQNVRCAHHAHRWVEAHPDFQVLHEPTLYIYSFRYAPRRYRSEEETEETRARLDWLNQRIADELQATGRAFVMTSRIHGRTVLRLSICSHRTRPEDVEAVLETMAEIGARLEHEEGGRTDGT